MKQINTRISQKHDFESNWLLQKGLTSELVPYNGEIIIYDAEVDSNGYVLAGAYLSGTTTLPDNRTSGIPYARIKIGDGVTPVNSLPFASNGEGGFSETDEFVFYCGDASNLTADPFESAEYIVACGSSSSLK